MTDNEIIKAMQCVIGNDVKCSECTYQKVLPFPSCRRKCAKNALDLINRQKAIIEKSEKVEHFADKTIETANAEIERLNEKITAKDENNYYFMGQLRLAREKLLIAKSEAIKEFAERLKETITNAINTYYNSNGGGYYLAEDVIEDIDNLVKEMMEVKEW